ncbi:Rieske 2Fe-2S domain-containing protein [Parachlamydia sp. AcF125]|uniref:Rieske (2Fe-2S) protein n=1 Tax=Parachlamydia sp. AcF125 TaxID=2795736 RepID=UPI001BC956FF|nr:Rieske 2Fe-2S domain-containing protein [Parachlamydia sp. AcF125]MBS4168663.1 Assimilatory nitrite reductase [NAD(P)H] small subunit [Parachlamydia sp. AcF125]
MKKKENQGGVKLALVSDIPEGKSIIVEGPEGLCIALFKLKGEIFALNNACPHMGGPLGEGCIEQETVTCPWHGWQFNIQSGYCDNMQGNTTRKISIRIEQNLIYLVN